MNRDELIEKMARAMLNWVEPAGFKPWGIERDVAKATAALTALENAGMAMRADVLEEAAKVAEGPPIEIYSETGEVSLRGSLNGGNWSVPQPIAGYRGSDYGTGRYDAAAAIRAMIAARPVRIEEKE